MKITQFMVQDVLSSVNDEKSWRCNGILGINIKQQTGKVIQYSTFVIQRLQT